MAGDTYKGYFGRPKFENRKTLSFAFGNIDHVKSALDDWRQEKDPTAENDNPAAEEPDFSDENALTTALSNAVEFALAQHHLVGVVEGSQQIFSRAFITTQIFNKFCSKETLVEDTENYSLWGINEKDLHVLDKAKDDLDHLEYGLDALPNAALLSIVATFDTLLYDQVGGLLKLNPDRHGHDRSITLKDIIVAKKIEDLVDKILEEELYNFSRDSHEEQTKYIEKNFGFKIIETWKRWPDFIEVFERRNLIAHGQKVFTQRYVDICKKNGHKGCEQKLGEKIDLNSKYLRQAIDILLEYAMLVPFSYWRKQNADVEKKAFASLNEATFKLIVHSRNRCASRICEYALGLKNANIEDAVRRMLVVNYASALMHIKENDKSLAVLNAEDWSACTDDFRICVAALRQDLDQIEKIMPKLKMAKDFPISNYRVWPVFDFVRDEDRFISAVRQAYGEGVTIATDALDRPVILDASRSDIQNDTLESLEGSIDV